MPPMSKLLAEETEPKFEWVKIEGCDTLLIHLPGYLKENLKVQVTKSRNLLVIGERKGIDGKPSRFQNESRIPDDCDINGITAKFEGGVLRVKLPKVTGSAVPKEEAKQEDIKHTSSLAAAASAPEDKKPQDKIDNSLAEAVDEKGAEGHGNGSEKLATLATEDKHMDIRRGKSWMKKVTLLGLTAVIIGVGVAFGLSMLQTKGCVCQMVNDMWRVTVNPSRNICEVSHIPEM